MKCALLQFLFDRLCFSAKLLVFLDLTSSVSRPKLLLVQFALQKHSGWVCLRQGMLKTFPDPLAALLLMVGIIQRNLIKLCVMNLIFSGRWDYSIYKTTGVCAWKSSIWHWVLRLQTKGRRSACYWFSRYRTTCCEASEKLIPAVPWEHEKFSGNRVLDQKQLSAFCLIYLLFIPIKLDVSGYGFDELEIKDFSWKCILDWTKENIY